MNGQQVTLQYADGTEGSGAISWGENTTDVYLDRAPWFVGMHGRLVAEEAVQRVVDFVEGT